MSLAGAVGLRDQAFADGADARFNNRHNDYLFRDTLMGLVSADALEYKALIA